MLVCNNGMASPNHLYWPAIRGEWIAAAEFDQGELLRTAEGSMVPVETVGKPRHVFVSVYNIEVEEFHTYFVGRGEQAVLAHNGWHCIKKRIVEDAPNTPIIPCAAMYETSSQSSGEHRGSVRWPGVFQNPAWSRKN